MLDKDMSNCTIIAKFIDDSIEYFSDMDSLIQYMLDEGYCTIQTLQCNYWGTCVINNDVELKKNGDKFYLG